MRRPSIVAAAAAVALLWAQPPSAHGADPDAAQVLASRVRASVAADVDSDGVRDVVLIVDGGAARTVEVWSHTADRWERRGQGPLTFPDRAAPNAAVDPERQAVALMAWRDEAGEHALLVSAGDAGDYGGGCCLVLGLVELEGQAVGIRPLDGPGGRAESVRMMDADADGVDELLVIEPRGGAGEGNARILRWTGDAFVGERVALGAEATIGGPVLVGESDGIPGDEALFTVDGGRGLARIAGGADGTSVVERASVDGARELHLWGWGAAGGRIVAQVGTDLQVLAWPRGGPMTTLARQDRPEYPNVHLVGTGSDAVIVDEGVGGFDPRESPAARVLDLDLEQLAEVDAGEAVRDVWRLASVEIPALRTQTDMLSGFNGPVPGGYLSAGNLITPDEEAGAQVRQVSSFTGLVPVGLAGPDDAWWLMANGPLGVGNGVLVIDSAPPRSVSVVPEAGVLRPDEGGVDIALEDAVLLPAIEGTQRLAVDDQGSVATVSGPPGSRVLVAVDQWVVHSGVLPDAPVSLPIESRRPDVGNQPIEVDVVVVDPAGHASVAHWDGDVLRTPPEMAVGAETEPFVMRSVIAGRTANGARVSVDGRRVEVDAHGGFRVGVDASLWPRDVVVEVADVVGNSEAQHLEVVGFLDYRGLPWVAIVGLATLAAGAFLFLRTPHRRESDTGAWGDAQLEETDAELF